MRTSSPLRRTLYSIIGTAVCFFFLLPDTAYSQAYISSSKVYYPGSAGFTRTDGLVADNSANTYLLSRTQQNTFQPTIPYAAKGTGFKSVLMKHDANNNLLWSRYLPHSASGTGNTMFSQIVVDGNNVHLLGVTTATDVPVTHGPAAGGGGSDIIYARVDATTGNLLTTLYLGGNSFDGDGIGLAVHGGQVFLTYTTTSNNIPTTDGSAYTSGYDHVMARMDEQANIVYCVYTGSVNTTTTYTDTVSSKVSNGNAVLGKVVSNTNNFVTTDGSTVQGPYDYGIVKLGASGNKLFSIVYGGTGEEFSPEIEVLGNNVFITGITTSTNYPVTDGSAFPGSYRHVITKFNNSGQVVFSKYTAGIPAGTDYPQIAVEDGMVYVFGHAVEMEPHVNVTDGSSGGSYLIKMNAANGAVQFATRFGYVRTGSTVKASQLMVHNGQAFITFPAHNGPANLFTTDGSTMYTNGGTYIVALTETGKQFFATGRQTALNDGRVITNMVKTGNRLTVLSCHLSSATAHAPLTEPMTTPPATGGFLNLMTFEFCPSMPTENIISPLLQNICKGGFTQTISGNRVSKPSEDMPQLIKGANVSPQMEILARYQWQVATSPTGPWTNIVGLGTQKDFTPPSASETRYYRRLVLPPFGCGDDPVSISDVAAVIVDVNAAPVVVSLGAAPVAGYSYQWKNVAPGDETLSDPSVSPDTTTYYPVKITEATSGCVFRDTAKVTVRRVFANPGNDWITCNNVVIELGAPEVPGYTYSWFPQVAAYQDGTDHTSAQPKVLITTSQDFTLTVTDTETGCTHDSTISIIVDNVGTLTGLQDETICAGGSVVIGPPAQAGVTYSWSPATGLSSTTVAQPVASPTTTTVYTLSVTYYDALGNPICTKNGAVTVTVNAPSITGMSDVNLCPSAPAHNLGTGVNASGTGTLTYVWTPIHLVNTPNSLNSTLKANPTQPTTFTLTVTDGNGCTTSASKTITPTATPPDAGVPAQVCVGSSVQLGSTANTGSCTWTVSPAIAGTLSNANSPNPIFTPAAGDADKTFTFTLSEQIGGCTSKSTVDITVRQFNLPSMPVQTICSNASTTIGVAPEANVTYIWSPTTGLENPNAATTVVNNVTENRVYTLTGVHINGCIDQAQVTIGVNPVPAPTVVVPPVTVQVGKTPDPFQPQITPASGSYTYSWSPAQSVNNPYIPNATPYAGGIGNTTYTLTVTDEYGCTSAAQTQLSVVPLVATLPIHITSFRAIPALCNIQLKWETAQAENFSHFVIERSNNGTDYSEIAVIFHSSLRTSYQYTDNQRDNNKWYYRLKLVDKDGRSRYSPVVTAQATCLTSTTLKVYPNPARNYVHIESNQPIKRVVLLSITGQVLIQQEMNPANINRLYFPGNVKPGIYVVGVWDKEGNITYARLIKE
jgi:hypothetical protein